jgi:hypothetical protein
MRKRLSFLLFKDVLSSTYSLTIIRYIHIEYRKVNVQYIL